MIASFLEPRLPGRRSRRIAPLGFAACALLMLGACAEKEIIFKGEREDIREMTADTGLERAPDEADNVSRAIRLPSQVKNASWQQAIGTASHRVAHPALRSTPARAWSADIGAGDGRRVRITADPVVANGLVYTLDSGARVSAVNTAGQVVWSVDLIPVTDDEEEATGGGMAYDKGTLYVSSGFGRLTALDATSGGVRWQQRLESTGSGTPMIDNGLLYLVAGDDTGWAIDTSDGRVKWQIEAAPSVANVLGAPAPAIAGDYVVFAFGSGEITAAFKRGGLRRWGTNVGGRRVGQAASRISDITGSPVVVGRTIYVGNHSGRTAAISALDGTPVWTARHGALGPVWPAGDSVFAVTEQRQLVRFDAGSGEVIWARDLPGYVKQKPKRRAEVYGNYGPILAGGRIVVASNDGFLRFFSPQDGSLTASVEVPGGATTAPVVAQGTLYVVSTTGQLHAFR